MKNLNSLPIVDTPTLHLIPGISASGKTTVARYSVERLTDEGIPAKLVVPHTTRPRRSYEQDAIDYHFHTMEDFVTKYQTLCDDPGTTWAASKIKGHYYFNSDEATAPNSDHLVSVLPVSYCALDDVLNDHGDSDFAIRVLPVVIGEDLRDTWLSTVRDARVGRDLEAELEQQADFVKHYDGPVFNPAWQLEADQDAYYRQMRLIMAGADMIMQDTVER